MRGVHTRGGSRPQVLNYFLNLEYLFAEFYSCAAGGQGLPAALRGGGPASVGCTQAALTGFVAVRDWVSGPQLKLSISGYQAARCATVVPRHDMASSSRKAASRLSEFDHVPCRSSQVVPFILATTWQRPPTSAKPT